MNPWRRAATMSAEIDDYSSLRGFGSTIYSINRPTASIDYAISGQKSLEFGSTTTGVGAYVQQPEYVGPPLPYSLGPYVPSWRIGGWVRYEIPSLLGGGHFFSVYPQSTDFAIHIGIDYYGDLLISTKTTCSDGVPYYVYAPQDTLTVGLCPGRWHHIGLCTRQPYLYNPSGAPLPPTIGFTLAFYLDGVQVPLNVTVPNCDGARLAWGTVTIGGGGLVGWQDLAWFDDFHFDYNFPDDNNPEPGGLLGALGPSLQPISQPPTLAFVPTLPTSDASPNDWTAENGGAHYSELDEAVADNTTYVITETDEQREMFGVTEPVYLSGDYALSDVVISAVASRGRKDNSRLLLIAKSGVYEQADEVTVAIGEYSSIETVLPTSPTGLAWTPAIIDNTDFGFESIVEAP